MTPRVTRRNLGKVTHFDRDIRYDGLLPAGCKPFRLILRRVVDWTGRNQKAHIFRVMVDGHPGPIGESLWSEKEAVNAAHDWLRSRLSAGWRPGAT
jgi:hypothetical protein